MMWNMSESQKWWVDLWLDFWEQLLQPLGEEKSWESDIYRLSNRSEETNINIVKQIYNLDEDDRGLGAAWEVKLARQSYNMKLPRENSQKAEEILADYSDPVKELTVVKMPAKREKKEVVSCNR